MFVSKVTLLSARCLLESCERGIVAGEVGVQLQTRVQGELVCRSSAECIRARLSNSHHLLTDILVLSSKQEKTVYIAIFC